MLKITTRLTFFCFLAALASGVEAAAVPGLAAKSIDYNELVRKAFSGYNLRNLEPPKEDIAIKFPAIAATGQAAFSSVLKKGESWANLPIGVYLGLGNFQNDSVLSLAQKIYGVDDRRVVEATRGSLANFKFLDRVPVKTLVAAFPQIDQARLDWSQMGSWRNCGIGGGRTQPTFGLIANSSCGAYPIPLDVQERISLEHLGLHQIAYTDIANKLNINNLPTSDFFLAADLTFDKIFFSTALDISGTNLMKVDYLDTKVPGNNGNRIRGINSISGSNRVPNSTCSNDECDYAVLRSFILGGSADKFNSYNNNLAIQINRAGTNWLDGGIGSIGTTLWNFKEPPGVAFPNNSDRIKIVLENGNARKGTVEQKAYFAFCAHIPMALFWSEWNCSSKFIGPFPIPWPEVSEKNQAMLLPITVKAQIPVATPSAASQVSSPQPSIALAGSPAPQPSIAAVTNSRRSSIYSMLFGSNTLAAYSPSANLRNQPQ